MDKKTRIMLVDDSSLILKAFEGMLQVLDVEIDSYSSPTEAAASFAEVIPSVIISDFEMPEMDGLEFLKLIRKSEFTKDVPVIILTSHDEDHHVIECLKEGADDYLLKRSNPEVLITKVSNFIRLNKYREFQKQADQIEIFNATVASLNHEFNNIIQISDSYLDLSRNTEVDDEIKQKLEDSLIRLSDKIKTFKKIDKIELETYAGDTLMVKTD